MKKFKLLYVYILKCSDGTYYTGISNNPEKREIQHNIGFNNGSYTYLRRPVQLVYAEGFSDYNLAIEWEKRIQKWSKKKKEALIKNKWDELKRLSECKNKTSHKIFRENQKASGVPHSRISTTLDVTARCDRLDLTVSIPLSHVVPNYIVQKYPGLEYPYSCEP